MSSCTTDTITSTNAASPSSSSPFLHLVAFGADDQAELHIKYILFVLKTVSCKGYDCQSTLGTSKEIEGTA
jgi:hypothetical protein